MTGSRETVRCLGAMCVLDTWPVARQEFPEEFVPTRGGEQAEGIQAEVFGNPTFSLNPFSLTAFSARSVIHHKPD